MYMKLFYLIISEIVHSVGFVVVHNFFRIDWDAMALAMIMHSAHMVG